MITYNASDIVKRAMSLADIENSDFISFAEKISLLNEAYQTIYQKGLNKDVNAFVRYINTRNKVIQLPRDFYQLKAVTLGRDKDVRVILRRPANASFNTLSYDMINNTLQINGETSGGTVCVEYFPVPTTLTFPNVTKNLELQNVLDMHKDIYLEQDDTDVYIRSLSDTGYAKKVEFAKVPPVAIPRLLIHMEDDFITFSDSTTQYLFDLNTEQVVETNLPVVIYNHKTYLYDSTNKKLLIPNISVAVEDLEIDLHNCTINILSEDKTKYVGQNYNSGLFINGAHQDFSASKMFYWNDLVYLSNGSALLTVYHFGRDFTENKLLDEAIVSIVDINDNTGYGYLGKRLNSYNLVSFFDDTQLNFPNNTYFVFMSYLLALAFKSKQGSDTSQLAMQLDLAEETFYDTLARDDWNPTRITNVY